MQKTKDSVRDEQQQLALCGDTTSKSHVHSWGLRLSLCPLFSARDVLLLRPVHVC